MAMVIVVGVGAIGPLSTIVYLLVSCKTKTCVAIAYMQQQQYEYIRGTVASYNW